MNKISNIVFLISTIILSNSVCIASNVHIRKLLSNNKTAQTSTISNVRFVKLAMANGTDNFFNIAQVVCFDDKNINVTKGKTVKPNVASPYGINPNIITDGNENARPHPQALHLANAGGDFVVIDLGSNLNISSCVIYNRSDCCQNRVKGATLSLLDANNNTITGSIVNSQDNKITITFSNLASFIKLQMANNGDNFMNLSQIACFNRNGDNITKGKAVTANAPSPYGINPNNLTDGSLSARPHPNSFHSANKGNDWVLIDLGSPQEIKSCAIYNRSDCCGQRLIGARLSLLNSSKFENSYKIIATGNPSNTVEFDLPALSTSNSTTTSETTTGTTTETTTGTTTGTTSAATTTATSSTTSSAATTSTSTPTTGTISDNVKTQSTVVEPSSSNVKIVKLQMANNGDNFMNLSQIACFNEKEENVTKGKNVTPSSAFPLNPSILTDGTLTERPYPNIIFSANKGNDWISIDLGSQQTISRCEIYNRSDCCGNRIVGAKLILISGDTAINTKTITSSETKITISFP